MINFTWTFNIQNTVSYDINTQNSYGTSNQGFQFTIDYPSSIVHPTARVIFNKGGSPNSTAYPANSITTTFS